MLSGFQSGYTCKVCALGMQDLRYHACTSHTADRTRSRIFVPGQHRTAGAVMGLHNHCSCQLWDELAQPIPRPVQNVSSCGHTSHNAQPPPPCQRTRPRTRSTRSTASPRWPHATPGLSSATWSRRGWLPCMPRKQAMSAPPPGRSSATDIQIHSYVPRCCYGSIPRALHPLWNYGLVCGRSTSQQVWRSLASSGHGNARPLPANAVLHRGVLINGVHRAAGRRRPCP